MNRKNISTRGNRGMGDINHAALRANFNRTMVAATLAQDSGANIKNTGAIKYVIDGQFYSKTALSAVTQTVTASDDGSIEQASDTTCLYVYCLDAAGAVTAYKGVDDSGVYPAIPDGVAPFGVAKVSTVAATFEMGTTSYSASGVTSVFKDVSHVPSVSI